MKTYLTYGAINAIIGALFSLILFFTGYQTEKLATGQYIQLVGILIFIVVLFFGMREVRETKPNKAITYGGALGAAVMISLFSGLFSAVYDFIHFTFINTDFATYKLALARETLEKMNLPEAQIDTNIAIQEKMIVPWVQSLFIIIGTPIIGLIIGLILAIFVKKQPVEHEIKAS